MSKCFARLLFEIEKEIVSVLAIIGRQKQIKMSIEALCSSSDNGIPVRNLESIACDSHGFVCCANRFVIYHLDYFFCCCK